MLNNWNDTAPIYRQLAQQLAGQLLDGEPKEGQPMPSVRQLAQQYLINPLTVSRALQSLVDEGFLEPRRGLGMYVTEGARQGIALPALMAMTEHRAVASVMGYFQAGAASSNPAALLLEDSSTSPQLWEP